MRFFYGIKTILALSLLFAFFNGFTKDHNLGKIKEHQNLNNKKFQIDCEPAKAASVLMINNVKSHLGTGGELFYQANTTAAGYEVPKGSGLNSIYAGGVWVGALDDENNLKLAATKYRYGSDGAAQNDFWPGVLDEDGEVDKTTCEVYDKIWSVTKAEIDAFKTDWDDGALDSEASENIIGWKGPFIDVDGDQTYNPLKRDFPDIKGDEARWYVINDNGNVHTASQNSNPLGLEIETIVYAFETDDLKNITFVEQTLTNKSKNNLKNTWLGTWLDPDLGEYSDDFIGCDTTRNLAICYNGDALDDPSNDPDKPTGYGKNPPFLGVQILDGISNEVGLKLGMSSFVYYNDERLVGMSTPQTAPVSAQEHYNFLKGFWKDGTALTNGGTGYNSESIAATRFAYPGNPTDENSWSECTVGNTPGDRKFIMSTGPFNMNMGASKSITKSVLWVRDTLAYDNGCPTFQAIQKLSDDVLEFYNENIKADDGPPIITITGETTITILQGSENWELPSATAIDGSDGMLPVNVNLSEVDVNTPGIYQVIYTATDSDNNSATATVTVIVEQTIGVPNFSSVNITHFPNPASNYIKFKLNNNKATLVEIYDLNGRLVQSNNLISLDICHIELNKLNTGIYLYKILNEGNTIFANRFLKR